MTHSDIPHLIVDRIEGDIAVLEGEHGTLDVPIAWLPAGAGEGSVLRVEVRRDEGASDVILTLDPDAQAAREADLARLRSAIPEGPGGDIAL